MTGAGNRGHDQRQEQAAIWFTRLNSGEATRADIDDFQRWYRLSPENADEYQKLEKLWTKFDNLPAKSRAPRQPAAYPHGHISRRGLLIGGSAAAAVLAAGWIGNFDDYIFSDEFTSIAEIREATLPDGSKVTLDANTAIAIDFSDKNRVLHLQRGRAFFDVAKDQDRPFRITARGGTIEALGTQFVVSILDDEVNTSVQESAVSVNAPGGANTRITPGQMVSYRGTSLGRIETANAEIETAWRYGRLIFNDRPLRSVVADVNRYRRGRLQIIGSSLEQLRVSGVFDVKHPENIVEAIIRTLPVRAIEVTPLLIVLLPAEDLEKMS